MEALFILIGFSVAVAILFLTLFIRAVRAGQYDDPRSPGTRILDAPRPPKTKQSNPRA
ncbi:MAG: cbb3-type cytochrome oxidase assembly protein CcoS [Bacteroidia bacterium]|nr:cbb3-type cytochrome oxidase assembly protein CcoS [Bacteroidia bacterium]